MDKTETMCESEEPDGDSDGSDTISGLSKQPTQTHLRNFEVLDDLDMDDDDGDEDDEDSDSDVPEEEIEAMLEEGLPEEFKRRKKRKTEDAKDLEDDELYEQREKISLIEKDQNLFEVLPEGWICIPHVSGMPIYLHRPTRVISTTKPYFIGSASSRKHAIPVSAVPCLQYKRALEKEKEEEEKKASSQQSEENSESSKECALATTFQPKENLRVDIADEVKGMTSLAPEEYNEYCRKLFQFKTIKYPRFKSWEYARKFIKEKKRKINRQGANLPGLPGNTKLLHIPVPVNTFTADDNAPPRMKEFILNPEGKSYSCILHEYLQKVFKVKPEYTFSEIDSAATPFQATLYINNVAYGTGSGSSKKHAKMDAARAALRIMIPQAEKLLPADIHRDSKKEIEERDLSFFDDIKITDPRVTELCNKTSEPAPFNILLTCLQKNFGLGPVSIVCDMKANKHRMGDFSMRVGKHSVTVSCKNKRTGKQLASQAILQSLHPNLSTFGSLLRLYGRTSQIPAMERKLERNEVTQLQKKSDSKRPNYAILNKLKAEMLKLKDRKMSVQSIRSFVLPDDITLPEHSGVDLDNIDLQ